MTASKPTILIATPYFFPAVGGMENYALAMARGLAARGFKVIVVCGDHVDRIEKSMLDSLTIYRLPIWKTVSNTPVNPAWYKMLRRIITSEQPDIINAHTPVPFMVDMVALAAGKTPFIVTYHAATLFKPGNALFRLIALAYMPIQHYTLRRARHIFAVSDYVKQSFSPKLQRKTLVTPNATTLKPVKPGASPSGLVFVNNLEATHAWKGLDLILDSLAVLAASDKDVPSLTIIGDGNYRTHYEERVASLGLSASVHFAGRLVGTQRDRLMAKAQALVMYPTTANDAFPTVLLEAWSLGLPVIASAIGPIPSLITHGQTGLLVAPNDPHALAGCLDQAMLAPHQLAIMGTLGKRRVRSEYNWDTQITRTGQLLEKLA